MSKIKLTYPGKTVDLELTREIATHILQNPGFRPKVTGQNLHAFPETLGLTLTGPFSLDQLQQIIGIVCDGLRKPTDTPPPAP